MHIQKLTIHELDRLSESLNQMASDCPDRLVRFALVDLLAIIAQELLSRAIGPELARDIQRERDLDEL